VCDGKEFNAPRNLPRQESGTNVSGDVPQAREYVFGHVPQIRIGFV